MKYIKIFRNINIKVAMVKEEQYKTNIQPYFLTSLMFKDYIHNYFTLNIILITLK